jgi:hypothetical protein
MMFERYVLFILLLIPNEVLPFVLLPRAKQAKQAVSIGNHQWTHQWTLFERPQKQQTVYLEPKLSKERITSLFAWLSRAFAGDEKYNNLMLAMAAIFGTNLQPDSQPLAMVQEALAFLNPDEEEVVAGAPIPLREREQASLGAMGAGQWTGQFNLDTVQSIANNGSSILIILKNLSFFVSIERSSNLLLPVFVSLGELYSIWHYGWLEGERKLLVRGRSRPGIPYLAHQCSAGPRQFLGQSRNYPVSPVQASICVEAHPCVHRNPHRRQNHKCCELCQSHLESDRCFGCQRAVLATALNSR